VKEIETRSGDLFIFIFSKMYFFIRGCDALLTYTIVIAEMDMNRGLKISSNMFVNV